SPAIGLLIRTGSSVATEVACEENNIFSILRKSSWPRISRITRKASRRSRFRPRSRRLLLISRFDLTVAAVIGAVNKLESSVIPVIPLLAVMQGGESPYSNFFTAPSLTAAGPMPSPCWSRGSPRPRSVDRTGSECSRRSASLRRAQFDSVDGQDRNSRQDGLPNSLAAHQLRHTPQQQYWRPGHRPQKPNP